MKRLVTGLAVLIAASLVSLVATAETVDAAKPSPPGPSVYVASTTGGTVTVIDPATLAVTRTLSHGAPWTISISLAGDNLYYSWTTLESSYGSVGRIHLPTAQTVPNLITNQYVPLVRSVAGDPNTVFVGNAAQSPAILSRWVVTRRGRSATLAAVTPHGPVGSSLGDFAVSADGTKLWTASGYPYEFVELNASTMQLTGRAFPANPYPTSIDTVTVNGAELIAGGTDSVYWLSTHVYNALDPATALHFRPGESMRTIGGIALSPDGARVHQIVSDPLGNDPALMTLSTADGTLINRVPVAISSSFVEGIDVDPNSGRVFVALENGVGVFAPDGSALSTITGISTPRQILIG